MLINNAGIADARGVAAEQFDTATFNQIISVDLLGLSYTPESVDGECLNEVRALSSTFAQSWQVAETKTTSLDTPLLRRVTQSHLSTRK